MIWELIPWINIRKKGGIVASVVKLPEELVIPLTKKTKPLSVEILIKLQKE